MRRRAAWTCAVAIALAGLLGACERTATWSDEFRGDVLAEGGARWCERYHHAHATDTGLVLLRSDASRDACTSGGGRSCAADGCDRCACVPPCSPCAKVGDPNGNAVIMTSFDAAGTRRAATARFTIERQLPTEAHVGLYVALHPHCHTTVQGLLVADAPGVFHLNVATFNQFIGGHGASNDLCRVDPFAEISPPLAESIRLDEGRAYEWELSAVLADATRLDVTTVVRDGSGARLAAASFTFHVPGAGRWFGVAGAAARYAFGAQYTLAASPSGGEPALRLESFRARP